jgi:hypothetical protein
MDLEQQTWVLAVSSDVSPTAYYLYHRQDKSLELLFHTQPDLLRYGLSHDRPVVIPAR